MIMSVLCQNGLYERQAKIGAMPKSGCFKLVDNPFKKNLVDNVYCQLKLLKQATMPSKLAILPDQWSTSRRGAVADTIGSHLFTTVLCAAGEEICP
jgi:hypothetical protein